MSGIAVQLGKEIVQFDDSDRIFGIIYRIYHDKIDPYIKEFENSLNMDKQAIGVLKSAALEKAINSDETKNDLEPFAAEYFNSINDYRYEHEEDYVEPRYVLIKIHNKFEIIGDEIFDELLKKSIFQGDFQKKYLSLKRKYLEEVYLEEVYLEDEDLEECTESVNDIEQSLEKFVTEFWEETKLNEVIQRRYFFFHSEAFPFRELDNLFTECKFEYGVDLVKEARHEIIWRQMETKELVKKLRDKCEQIILHMTWCMLAKFDLKVSEKYNDFINHVRSIQISISVINQNKIDEKTEKEMIELIKVFPFESIVYKALLKTFGDDEKHSVLELANYFGYGSYIEQYKEALFKDEILRLPWIIKKNEEKIRTSLKKIDSIREFYNYQKECKEEIKLKKRLQDICESKEKKQNQLQEKERRTVRGITYATIDEARLAEKENLQIDNFIKKCRETNDVKEQKRLIESFDINFKTQEAIKRKKQFFKEINTIVKREEKEVIRNEKKAIRNEKKIKKESTPIDSKKIKKLGKVALILLICSFIGSIIYPVVKNNILLIILEVSSMVEVILVVMWIICKIYNLICKKI